MPNPLFEDDHFIGPDDASEMTALFRDEKENILAEEYRNLDLLSNCETFSRSAFDAILADEDCAGVRIYFGMNSTLKIKTIIVGVDEENNDILPPQEGWNVSSAKIVQAGRPCPEFCPSVLL